MAENSAIEWTDHTFNPWIGCTKVSTACDNCYAESMMDVRYGRVRWGAGEDRSLTGKGTWAAPRKWNRDAEKAGTRPFVFCASLADVFDNEVDEQWRWRLWRLIEETPNLVWLLLTKRIGNVAKMTDVMRGAHLDMRNVAIGATFGNQEEYDRDRMKLFDVRCRLNPLFTFGSFEPLLGPVVLDKFAPDWIIVGGESGPGARPMHPDWARALRDQCAAAGVPFFFKQFGEWGPDVGPDEDFDRDGYCRDRIMEGAGPCRVLVNGRWQEYRDGYAVPIELCSGHGEFVYRLGKKRTGRLLDGRTHDGMPEVFNA